VFLPYSDASRAETVARRLDRNYREEDRDPPLRASIGVVSYDVPPDDVEVMVHDADLLMYEAKRLGQGELRIAHHPRPLPHPSELDDID
jgi:GGDEF domain-containing protein